MEIPTRKPKLFGQQKPGECAYGRVTGRKIHHAAGVVVDRRPGRDHIYVVDTGNNRILGFRGIDSLTAERIFGQPDEFSGAPNGDCRTGTFGAPARETLCLVDVPGNTNIGEQWMRVHIDVDSAGDLYVPDFHNNRVLVYFAPFDAASRSGGGDALADFVIGQDDFTSNGINRGNGRLQRDNRGLHLSIGGVDHVAARGVSVDVERNVWVADTFNHRVLRFPGGSRAADLVLGAQGFDDPYEPPRHLIPTAETAPLDRVYTPTIARINPRNGELWVMDEYPRGFWARMLVFRPPFKNGMAAERAVFPQQRLAGDYANGFRYHFAGGLVFNSFLTDDLIYPGKTTSRYRDGVVWVHDRTRVLLLDERGEILLAIAAPDLVTFGGRPDVFIRSGLGETTPFNLRWPGPMSFDSANNIYVADESYHRISRYALPFRVGRNDQNEVTVPASNGGLCPGTMPNEIGPANFSGWNLGAFAYHGQLVVRDYRRYMIWTSYMKKLVDGPPADIIAAGTASPPIVGRAMHTVDDADRVWTINFDRLMAIQLPFTEVTTPLRQAIPLHWADDGTEVAHVCHQPVAFERATKALWIFDRLHYRLLRVRIPPDIAGRFVVDAVIGQRTKSGNQRNSGMDRPHAAGFAEVSDIRFDGHGNMFVVDNGYECRGPAQGQNGRVLTFMARDLDAIATLFPDIEAKLVFVSPDFAGTGACRKFDDRPHSPVSVAFNSRNEMVLGNDGYYLEREIRAVRQLYLYRDPLARQTPDAIIELPMGAPGELWFDEHDNLIVQDHTWAKVWIINLDIDTHWLRPLQTG